MVLVKLEILLAKPQAFQALAEHERQVAENDQVVAQAKRKSVAQ